MADRTIDRLKAHAEQVCIAVLGPAAASVLVFAYIAGENLPSHISATHEYMIVIDFSKVPEIVGKALPRFESFLGKRVLLQGTRSPVCLYWGEGNPLDSCLTAPVLDPIQRSVAQTTVLSPFDSIEWMKTDTTLPFWLETVLFDKLGARHEPDWQRFEYNLDLNEDEIKRYLGTYFPRSYTEAFCIIDALFEHSAYGTAWEKKLEASILDVGTGTGGNIVGLLTALAKHCPKLKRVIIHGYDGSPLALSATREILQSLESKVPFALEVKLTKHCITTLDALPKPHAGRYDFITTFKTGCEIIARGSGSADDFYYKFLYSYADLLSDLGLMILLDVTTKPEHTNFYPQLLNEQVSRFVREQPDFATLVPVPCNIYEGRCSETCFTQKEFSVTHRMASHDPSRVTYRVLSRAACGKRLHAAVERAAEYVICNKPSKDTFNTCSHSSGRGAPLDGYRIGALLRGQ